MSYRCTTCNKELEDYILVCDNCGAVKIDVPKKEDIKNDENLKKRPPYFFIGIIIVNIVFMVLAIKNFTNSDALFLYGSIAIVTIVFGNIFFPQSKLLRGILSGELIIVYGIITLPFVVAYILIRELVGGWL